MVIAVVVFLQIADTIRAIMSAQKVSKNNVIPRSTIGHGVISGLDGNVTLV